MLAYMRVLGIETSCDETSAAVVEDGRRLLSCVVATSLDLHAEYGGVIPEIAARSHIESIMPVIEQALAEAVQDGESDDPWENIDAIAVTYGAGLGGCLLVGVMTARTLAITKDKPLYAINHVEAHAYVNFLTEASPALTDSYDLPNQQPVFPALALIVSGGHSQLVLFRDHFDYTLLGQTVDDAIGEAFDKVAKVIGLPYPGGPSISKLAPSGNPNAYDFPKANLHTSNPKLDELRNQTDTNVSHKAVNYDFSFSGPKTAVLRTVQKICGKSHDFPSYKLAELLDDKQKADVAASFPASCC
jgi:N6-L-threonylcarbamoyladenine synthase